jgi:hypothetical protein
VIAVLLVVVGPVVTLVYRRSLVIAVLLVVVGPVVTLVYRSSLVIAVLLSPNSDGKPEAANAVVVAPDDGHEDVRNMLSCI